MSARVLTAAEVLDFRTIVAAKISHDGRRVAYAVSGVSEDRAEDRVQLCLLDLASGEARTLTPLDAMDTVPSWLPDDSGIVFRSTRTGTPQVHRVDPVSAEIAQLSEHPLGVGSVGPAVSPTGDRIAFAAAVRPPRDRELPYRVTDAIWRLDGIGLIDDAAMELFVMPAGGGEAQRLTDHDAVPVTVEWSPDGTRLMRLCFKGGDEPTWQLRILDVDQGTDTLIWETAFLGVPPAVAWAPDGRIVRSTPILPFVGGERPDIVVTDASPNAEEDVRTGATKAWFFGLLQGDFPFDSFEAPRIVVAPGGDVAFASAQKGGRLGVWSIPLTGDAAPQLIIDGDQASVPLDASEDQLLIGTSTMHEPVDLWMVDHRGAAPRRLTSLNRDRHSPERHFSVRPLEVTGADGAPVEAWFLMPRGADGPVPTILTNHGGPHTGWGHIFSYDFAMVAGAGYGTLLVNQRGSTGYSTEFATQLYGDWGNHDVSDLERALDVAIAEGLADPSALAARGVSGGGYLTAWLITHGDRFKAAIVESGALDWNAMMGADLPPLFVPWLKGGPLEREGTYADRTELSPTLSASRCSTPTLIVHHEQDLRTPISNADVFFGLLKEGGCTAEMLRMPLTSHAGSLSLGDPATRMAENEALLEWLARHVGVR